MRRWRKDVVFGVSDDEILEMLVRHFSLADDRVLVVGNLDCHDGLLGRDLNTEAAGRWRTEPGIRKNFYDSALFRRFAIRRRENRFQGPDQIRSVTSGIEICRGIARLCLTRLILKSLTVP